MYWTLKKTLLEIFLHFKNIDSVTILTSSSRVKPRFSKFTFKKSWLENYSLKITRNHKILVLLGLKTVYFFVRDMEKFFNYAIH